MYSMVCTGPNSAYELSRIMRYIAIPGKAHFQALKWEMKYLGGSLNMSLVYRQAGGIC